LGAAATRQQHYSSIAVPHDTRDVNDNNHHQKNCRELPTSHSGDDLFVPDRTIGLTKGWFMLRRLTVDLLNYYRPSFG